MDSGDWLKARNKIQDRHRAGGDAFATAKIFDQLLKRDNVGAIEKSLKEIQVKPFYLPTCPRKNLNRFRPNQGYTIF